MRHVQIRPRSRAYRQPFLPVLNFNICFVCLIDFLFSSPPPHLFYPSFPLFFCFRFVVGRNSALVILKQAVVLYFFFLFLFL